MKWPPILSPRAAVGWLSARWQNVCLVVVGGNILMTGADVYFAHRLAQPGLAYPWLPVYFSALCGPFLIVLGLGRDPGALGRLFHQLLLWLGVGMGLAGFYFHMTIDVGNQPLLKSLVYRAPIAAPLVYAGVSLFGLAILEAEHLVKKIRRAQVLLLIVAGGFAGNTILSLLDHAQNHFFSTMEWAPVVVSLFATIHCFLLALKPAWNDKDRGALYVTLWVQVVFGIIGFFLHFRAVNMLPPGDGVARFFYGAPLFAPLLLVNVAAYGILTLLEPQNAKSADTPPA